MEPLSHHLLTQAYNNGWANHRLYKACLQLTQDEFVAPRCSFFPSIKATLNHLLTVDWFYLDALECEQRGEAPDPDGERFFVPEQPFATCTDLHAQQVQADQRLITYCRQLRDDQLGRYVSIARPERMQHEPRLRLLSHLFEHQIHHRGQVHAMLSDTSIRPPQLDEFFCEEEASLRAEDFAALGWSEAQIWAQR
ncbi:damage-inducible protein DinB [Pseudomonas sp. 250J]|uniref:DinB family protein n=1 Tax=Pseudomonas TaxID=286 RepID=UPI000680AD56|nr:MULTISPECIES: DinB family protein [Pseudomonas]KNX78700.1 damage-inducible protein DinB [Pseudomonas sp. 250J]MCU7282983.1 DinB family protein [Pseudomonas peradeniyensis]QZA56230.1 DinB family protein [Pseudomonas sp. 2hn]